MSASGVYNDWFYTWFNSPYYHKLYKHRDIREAREFIDYLISYLKPSPKAKILDLACGKGRHSIYLNQKGFDVTGLDLSKDSIESALAYENESLKFFVHDMRKVFAVNTFDYILNLFTSFGYFDEEQDNLEVIKGVYKALKPGGLFVLDFMNVEKALYNLTQEETKSVEGINFCIRRLIENGFIVKNIEFTDKGKTYHFQEKVKILTLEKFIEYFNKCNFKIINLFGDYKLNTFDRKNSDRLILISKIDKENKV